MVLASTRPGDSCLDFFAGSGTLGAVAAKTGRRFVLIDSNPEAVRIATERLTRIESNIDEAVSDQAGMDDLSVAAALF